MHGAPLYGWCRDCRAPVDDRHIRSLRPDHDPRAAIYWLGEPDHDDTQTLIPAPLGSRANESTMDANEQLRLFAALP